ncbi:MBOAT family O-acyltransferase [Camelimonas abortus]|uniref:Probable alginate O-acetylase AlgI n=1 Tax=Camelimonas abortus TaxID=1017184 RepID=A0ABV7LC91_9HYPH
MLFNSFVFLLLFLPFSLATHWLAARYRPEWRLPLLLLLSFAFYSYWDWRFAPLLAASILFNWALARIFCKARLGALITLAICVNLLVLGVFKYAGFFSEFIPGLNLQGVDVFGSGAALPLGISFFTFHHVMYLVDLRAGRAPEVGLVRYGLYIAFFPQVLAGPLVRWSEILHQFDQPAYARPDAAERFARGLLLLCIGLAKKVLVGDPLAAYVNPVFEMAAKGEALTMAQAWQGVLGFTFQIYFDFSGYTDMALGIALLFGVVLPQNFETPYRALSLQDFWRRWHMTLSRFLRDYLYIPLGGNRHGLAVQLMALFVTMALGGLWHGAGMTFVAWGAAHGVALGVGVLWRKAGLPMPAPLGWALTFLFVVFAWVLFRAEGFHAAVNVYEGMLGLNGAGAGMKWRAIAIAAAVAMIGPTAWEAAHRAPPSRLLAAVAAIVFTLILFKIGDDANYEFIYFQF